jgi:integrase
MARRIRDAALETRAARAKLRVRAKPYYRAIDRDLHLGYRKGKRGGTWLLRRYIGSGDYAFERLGVADDHRDADGGNVLDFFGAQERARKAAFLAPTSAAPFTVAIATEDYLGALQARGKPILNAKSRIDNHILPTLGRLEVAKLETRTLRKWLTDLAMRPKLVRGKKGQGATQRAAPETDEQRRQRQASANRTLTILKAALNHVFREGKVLSDATWRKVRRFEEVDAARVRYLSQGEIARFINACDKDFRPLVKAALVTGARYGELTRLHVDDFNSDAGTIHVRMSKSGKARYVALGNEGWELFRQFVIGREPQELVLTKTGGAWKHTDQVRRMRETCERAKITPRVGFHILRHTYAASLVMAGVPLNVVSRNLGHADTKITEKHYAHLAPSYIAETIRRFSPIFGLVETSNAGPLVER